MSSLPRSLPIFRTIVRRKEMPCSRFSSSPLLYGGYRAVRAAVDSLRALPRCNEDMIFY